MWPRDCSCDIFMKIMAALYPSWKKIFLILGWKYFGLVVFTNEISKAVLYRLYLVAITGYSQAYGDL